MRRSRVVINTSKTHQKIQQRWQTTYNWAIIQEMSVLEDIVDKKQKFINVFDAVTKELMFATSVSNTDISAVERAIANKQNQKA